MSAFYIAGLTLGIVGIIVSVLVLGQAALEWGAGKRALKRLQTFDPAQREVYFKRMKALGLSDQQAADFADQLGPYLDTPLGYILNNKQASEYLFNTLTELQLKAKSRVA